MAVSKKDAIRIVAASIKEHYNVTELPKPKVRTFKNEKGAYWDVTYRIKYKNAPGVQIYSGYVHKENEKDVMIFASDGGSQAEQPA